MLQILILIALCRNLGTKVRAKGRNAVWFQVLLVALWFGGQFAGGFVAALIAELNGDGAESATGWAYLLAFAGAAAGAVTVFAIVRALDSKLPDDDPRALEYFQPPPPMTNGNPGDTTRPVPPDDRSKPDERFRS